MVTPCKTYSMISQTWTQLMDLIQIQFMDLIKISSFFNALIYVCIFVCMLSHSVMSNSLQLIDWSLPGYVHGISQARILEWVAISFFRGSSWLRDQTHISYIDLQILCHWATREAQLYIYNVLIFFLPSVVSLKIWHKEIMK